MSRLPPGSADVLDLVVSSTFSGSLGAPVLSQWDMDGGRGGAGLRRSLGSRGVGLCGRQGASCGSDRGYKTLWARNNRWEETGFSVDYCVLPQGGGCGGMDVGVVS